MSDSITSQEQPAAACTCSAKPRTDADILTDAKERIVLYKEIYIQTQNWARHNETLIIATNTILLGSIAAIAAAFFKDPRSYQRELFWLPFAIAILGVIMTLYLSWQYKLAITRVVVYEEYFKLHEHFEPIQVIASKHSKPFAKWKSNFVPEYLSTPPIFGPATTYGFLVAHVVILAICSVMLCRV